MRPILAVLAVLALAGCSAPPPTPDGGTDGAPDAVDVGAPTDAPLEVATDARPDSAPAEAGSDAASEAGPDVMCSAPRTACGGACVDTSSDMENCGGCGERCTLLECVDGMCRCGPPGVVFDLCSRPDGTEYCTSLRSADYDCGACGRRCPGDRPHCVDAMCVP